MRSVVWCVVFLLFFGFFGHSYANGISSEYGKLAVSNTRGGYTVAFILNSTNKKFAKIQKVEMTDSDNDGEGNVSVVLYRNGNKEVFFRGEDDYSRYVAKDASANVCEDDWSPKIVYYKYRRAWVCSKINFFVKFFMWREIDAGLADAKQGDWSALTERMAENIKKIAK